MFLEVLKFKMRRRRGRERGGGRKRGGEAFILLSLVSRRGSKPRRECLIICRPSRPAVPGIFIDGYIQISDSAAAVIFWQLINLQWNSAASIWLWLRLALTNAHYIEVFNLQLVEERTD